MPGMVIRSSARQSKDAVEILCLSELKIQPGRRKAYCYGNEFELKAKEFDVLCLLAVNKGYVLTYTQIYEKLWGQDSLGNENNSVD